MSDELFFDEEEMSQVAPLVDLLLVFDKSDLVIAWDKLPNRDIAMFYFGKRDKMVFVAMNQRSGNVKDILDYSD